MRGARSFVHFWAEKPVIPSPEKPRMPLPRCAPTTATSASEPFVIHILFFVSTSPNRHVPRGYASTPVEP